MVRRAAAVLSGGQEGRGPTALEALGCRGSLQRISQTLLELLHNPNSMAVALALCLHMRSLPVFPLTQPRLELVWSSSSLGRPSLTP